MFLLCEGLVACHHRAVRWEGRYALVC
ncbi:MAG: hypothetical protein JWP51_633, partial [Bradyrhizobium sp.]|nr:hypothetical protein [Bradyrhizobium sp.]